MPQSPLILLYRDENFLFIHKPAGIPFHSEDDVEGIVSIVRTAYQNETLFPVHRLDKVTSGVMVFARNPSSNRKLSALFEQRKVRKVYIALSDFKPKKKQGWIKGDMVKARGGSYKMLRTNDNPAITYFYSKKFSEHERVYFFVLVPKTGKTHQLRVAMKSLGSAILGDERYKGSGHARACLHAYGIQFTLEGKDYVVVDQRLDDDLFYGALGLDGCREWVNECGEDWLKDALNAEGKYSSLQVDSKK